MKEGGTGMATLELASIGASFVSMIVGGFAVWLALYPDNKSKETEVQVSESLANITS